MKLLISEMDALRSYVSIEWYHVMKTLVEVHDWINVDRYRLWNEPGTLKDKLTRQFERVPDVLLLWGGYDFAAAHRDALSGLECYKGYFVQDLHKLGIERSSTPLAFEICDVILAAYANVFADFYPEIADRKRVIWVPHSASPIFRLAFNDRAANSIFLSGAINDAYPLRQQMQALSENPSHAIVYQPHPGYHCGYDYARDPRIGKGYARRINSHRVAFTDALVHKYLVGKHFEIPACGALLLAERAVADDLRDLGFVEDVHYISVSSEDMEERIELVLDERNHPELDRVRKRGQALVWDRHTTTDRAKLIDDVCTRGA